MMLGPVVMGVCLAASAQLPLVAEKLAGEVYEEGRFEQVRQVQPLRPCLDVYISTDTGYFCGVIAHGSE